MHPTLTHVINASSAQSAKVTLVTVITLKQVQQKDKTGANVLHYLARFHGHRHLVLLLAKSLRWLRRRKVTLHTHGMLSIIFIRFQEGKSKL